MNKCKDCYYRMNTWAESLRETHNGCGILLDEHNPKIREFFDQTNEPDQHEVNNFLFNMFDIESFGYGWITNGGMCFNEQPIVQNVKKCSGYFKK